MATLILTAVGTVVGGPIGGAIGAVLGQTADNALFAPKPRQGSRLGDLAVQTSSYGTAIPKIFGTMRVAGTVIWSTDLIEHRSTTGGGKGRAGTVAYSYSASFAVALSGRPVRAVRRIWADGKLLRGTAGDFKANTRFRLYTGDEDQPADPLIVAAEGTGNAPAFRGTAYAMFEDLELADYGNRIPSLTFELVADEGAVAAGEMVASLAGAQVAASASPLLDGFAATGDSLRGAIGDLADLLPLRFLDDGTRLVVGSPAADAVLLSPACEVGRRKRVRGAEGSVPGELTLTYYDASRDYQTSLQRAVAGGTATSPAERRAVPAVLEAASVKILAERRLDIALAERTTATVTASWAAAAVKPGSLLSLPGENGRWRVERWTLGRQQVTLEMRRAPAAAATTTAATGAAPGRALAEADLAQGTTVLRLLDLPMESAGGTGVIAVAAGTAGGWRRAALSVSFDGGASWSDIGSTAAPAVLGSALTVLAPAGSPLMDMASSVEVRLLHDDMLLLSTSDDALVAGANLALLGDELIQFGSADRMAAGRWRLSRLLRGRRGTEWAALAHSAGEPFTLIDPACSTPVAVPAGIGEGAQLQMLASGPGDATPVSAELTLLLEARRSPSPVWFAATPDGTGGDLLLGWVRRSRSGWSWDNGTDAPLGEEREAYRLLFIGDAGTRSVETGSPAYLYTAAERAGDGVGPVTVEVSQVGSRALSRPATLTID